MKIADYQSGMAHWLKAGELNPRVNAILGASGVALLLLAVLVLALHG